MDKKDKLNKISSLEDLYNMAEQEGDAVNTENLLMDASIINSGIQLKTDYTKQMTDIFDESLVVVENMASLYFNENETIMNHKYIKDKIKSDAQNLSDLVFLQEIAKKTITKQLELVEDAEGSPRLFETMFLGMKEIREIIKQSTTMTSTMQQFYKELNIDLENKIGKLTDVIIEETNAPKTNIVSAMDLNNIFDDFAKNNKQTKK